eukprot:Lithocolla_globosa_v1_NODE_4324_length_1463_cov_2.737926.p2 type:complete len:172 gc:universal NODE_4324_length_1463_cov_2.737926:670-155(-)
MQIKLVGPRRSLAWSSISHNGLPLTRLVPYRSLYPSPLRPHGLPKSNTRFNSTFSAFLKAGIPTTLQPVYQKIGSFTPTSTPLRRAIATPYIPRASPGYLTVVLGFRSGKTPPCSGEVGIPLASRAIRISFLEAHPNLILRCPSSNQTISSSRNSPLASWFSHCSDCAQRA